MKRLCLVIPSLEVGGSERQLLRLLTGLCDEYETTVLCTRKEGALAPQARHLGARVHALGIRRGWDPRLRQRLRHEFWRHRPDIVHTFLFGFDLAANQAARQSGVPIVVSSRRELALWKRPRHIRRQRKANSLVDCIVANSQAVADYAIKQEGAAPGLFTVIPNGIDADAFLSMADPDRVCQHHDLPVDRDIVCSVANFSPVKDYPLFVNMAQELAGRREHVHFLAVGRGPLDRHIRERMARCSLDRFYTRLSLVDGIADVLKVASVVVLCSKMEGFPNAVMEAMAAGKPVVAAAVGGVTELIEDGVTGKLVHTRDPKDFAEAVHWVLDHPAESDAMGQHAAAWIRQHLPAEAMIDAHRELYANLLARFAKQVG
jgi:glycosyltransferase involved in cell wall biosynthesis